MVWKISLSLPPCWKLPVLSAGARSEPPAPVPWQPAQVPLNTARPAAGAAGSLAKGLAPRSLGAGWACTMLPVIRFAASPMAATQANALSDFAKSFIEILPIRRFFRENSTALAGSLGALAGLRQCIPLRSFGFPGRQAGTGLSGSLAGDAHFHRQPDQVGGPRHPQLGLDHGGRVGDGLVADAQSRR